MAMAAGIVTLRMLANDGIYRVLGDMGTRLAEGFRDAARAAECDGVFVAHLGSMLTVFFSSVPPQDYGSARKADADRYGRFFRSMLDSGVYLPPSQFETMFVSLAHQQKDFDHTIAAAQTAFAAAR
jgi:glutamate-1-semialdehyde 2,1-aminomutase